MPDHYSIIPRQTYDIRWTQLEPIYLGYVPVGRGTPSFFCYIEKDGVPYMRLHLYGNRAGAGYDRKIWEGWVVLAFADFFYFVSLESGAVRNYKVHWRVWKLYPQAEVLLATTSDGVYCYDKDANLLWQTRGLAEEWVEIEKVENGVIIGTGKFEPPSIITFAEYDKSEELVVFQLELSTGNRL
jgi:hypothetical protein